MGQELREHIHSLNKGNMFEDGSYTVRILNLQTNTTDGLRKPLLISSPSNAGEYPLVMLFHGFSLLNTFYTQLMRHISSHGYIVVAPQMYTLAGSDATQEILDGAAIINWIQDNPDKLVSPHVKPDISKLAVMGHSRGGKVVFGLALGLGEAPLPTRISALVALDPVDGTSDGSQTKPPILRFDKDTLKTGCPVLVVGAGLGSEKKFIFPSCAPERVGYKAFFRECCAPAFLFAAPEQGHMDFLDDHTGGLRGRLTSLVAKKGRSRRPMRTFAAGIVVAFLHGVLGGDTARFRELLRDPSDAPLRPYPPESLGEI